MKYSLAFGLLAALALTGCSSAFKMAGTPDDVYYSYGASKAGADTYAEAEEENGYASYFDNADDRYLRMKVQDRNKWSTIDDVNYWYGYNNPNSMWNPNWNLSVNYWNSPMGWNNWGWGVGFNSNPWMWNSPWMFNSYYNSWNNPWCWNRPVVVVNKFPTGGTPNYVAPRPSLNSPAYNNSIFDRGNYNRTGGKYTPQPAGYGNRELFRSIFSSGSGSSSGSSQGWSRPARLFDNSGSSSGGSIFSSGGSSRTTGGSSSGSSSSGSSGGSSRGGRGGN